MRNILAALLFLLTCSVSGADRELDLARAMVEDTIIRSDVEGGRLVRDRLLRIAATSRDPVVQRDAHYLLALSLMFTCFSGEIDAAATTRAIETGIRHADRAVEIDAQFADGWMLAAMLRGNGPRLGCTVPKDPPGTPNRFAKAMELGATSPGVAFFNGMVRSFNPAGAAPPAAVKLIDDLVERLKADRAASGRTFGVWDAYTHAWAIMVRMAQDTPQRETLRKMTAELLAHRPDFALGHQLDAAVVERRFVPVPALNWSTLLTDAPGDGKDPKLPDVVSVEHAEEGDTTWYRIAFRDALPQSFGVNVVVNRSGDPLTGMRWWGTGSDFRFDRLVTAWITRDGDRYFGRVGVTDDDGARGSRLRKFPAEISLAMDGDRRLIIGVPRDALDLTHSSKVIAAGGSHLVWNDDAISVPNSR